MRVAVDTNVLVYAQGQNDVPRIERARELFVKIPMDNIVLPMQALGELYWVLVRKTSLCRGEARDAVMGWMDTYAVASAEPSDLLTAMDASVDHQLSMWDALILCTAASAGCRILLSEDMAEGFTFRGVTVINPFAATPHVLLKAAMLEAY